MSKSVNTNSSASFSVTSDSNKIKDKDKDGKKGGIGPYRLESGWKYETEYVFDRYEANGEFGIWPTEYRQYAGSSGNPNRITKLNELKSKWGFNYIAANIGDAQNVTAIVNAGFPITSNYMALVDANQSGLNAIMNMQYGSFWSYYIDEPYSRITNSPPLPKITQAQFQNARNVSKQYHPNSNFIFGETDQVKAGYYTDNPYFLAEQYHINYYPTNVDFAMCAKYDDLLGRIDQRTLWDGFIAKYSNKFKPWISADEDINEFRNLLGTCRDNNLAPWFFQAQDGTDNTDQIIASYCQAAWLEGLLRRYDKLFLVTYRCLLNHIHDPNNPDNCIWEEYDRSYQGTVQR
ncbi:MAG: hypothetical protein CVV24_01990 [Ignavibacteriae bacterium HGW-Ignavibacteriae-3]|nr:MAG: hypothetical protein CVV24_01990 [Ignavibacteriae bacterium HGW-Ignavibacteriae-3]